MENKRELIQVLIALACEDGDFHPQEKQLIQNIARTNRIPEEELEGLIKEKAPLRIDFSKLSYEDRFEILYNLLAMMKADHEVLNQEIIFIQKIVDHLGFHLSAIMELYPHVHPTIRNPNQIKSLRKNFFSHTLEASQSRADIKDHDAETSV